MNSAVPGVNFTSRNSPHRESPKLLGSNQTPALSRERGIHTHTPNTVPFHKKALTGHHLELHDSEEANQEVFLVTGKAAWDVGYCVSNTSYGEALKVLKPQPTNHLGKLT